MPTTDRFRHPNIVGAFFATTLMVTFVWPVPVHGQPQADPDWPCVQRLVPTLAPAAIWRGPELPEETSPGNAELALARHLLDTHTSLDDARAQINAFAAGQPAAQRQGALGVLFLALLDTANTQRGEIIEAIKRYSRRQRALAGQINVETRKQRDLEAQGTQPALAEAADVKESRLWDLRVFDERQRALNLFCEKPVTIDQRVFALAQIIAEAAQ